MAGRDRSAAAGDCIEFVFRKDVRGLRLARIVNIDLSGMCRRHPVRQRTAHCLRPRPSPPPYPALNAFRMIARCDGAASSCEFRPLLARSALSRCPAAPLAAGFHAISATTTGCRGLIQGRSWPTRPGLSGLRKERPFVTAWRAGQIVPSHFGCGSRLPPSAQSPQSL
jgi:hypothetical protein